MGRCSRRSPYELRRRGLSVHCAGTTCNSTGFESKFLENGWRPPCSPGRKQPGRIIRSRLPGRKFKIVSLTLMNPTKIIGGAACPPISTKCFPLDEIIKVAVKPHEEHVKGFEQQGQVGCPLRFLKDVFQQEVIASRRIGDERAMEPFEKAIAVFCPLEVASPEPTHRQHSRVANMIN